MGYSGPKLILHVGQGKTGSSMLQSMLANSVPALASNGIFYPGFRDMAEAASGKISSGNLDTLEPSLEENFERAVALSPSSKTILFSNETIYHRYAQCESDVRAILAAGVKVEMILFIRDPLDQAASGFVQCIKRQGETGEFYERMKGYAAPEQFEKFVCDRRDEGVHLHIANYSRHSHNLTGKFCEFLGVDPDRMTAPPVKTVNRSLTGSELQLVQRLNRKYDMRTTSAITDALCNRLPDLAAGRPYLSPADFEAFRDRLAPMMEKANELLPEQEHYQFPRYEDYCAKGMVGPEDDLHFSCAQLDIIVDLLPDDAPPKPEPKGRLRRWRRKLFQRS